MNHFLLGAMTGQLLANAVFVNVPMMATWLTVANVVVAAASLWVAYSAIHRPQDWD